MILECSESCLLMRKLRQFVLIQPVLGCTAMDIALLPIRQLSCNSSSQNADRQPDPP